MIKSSNLLLLLGISLLLFNISCLTDQVEGDACEDEAYQGRVYTSDIQIIINNKCATAGCHINNNVPGNFDTYAGLLDYLPDGFRERSLDAMDMPPVGLPPLDEHELKALRCWLDSGHPEN